MNSQDYRHIYDSVDSEVSSEHLESSLDNIITKTKETYGLLETAKMSHTFSVQFYLDAQLDKAIKYGLIEINNYEELGTINDHYAKALFQVGLFHWLNGEVLKAIPFYEKVIDLNVEALWVGQSYGELGRCAGLAGDWYKSIDYYKKGISLLEEDTHNNTLISMYIDLAVIYEEVNTENSLKSKLEVLQKADRLGKEIGFSPQNLDLLNNAYANYYNNKSTYDFAKARKYYNNRLVNHLTTNDSSSISSSYTNLGNLYIKEHRDSAVWYLNRSLTYNGNKDHVALTYHNLCNYYLDKNDIEKALEYIHLALITIIPVGPEFTDLPDHEDLIQTSSKYNVMSILTRKATVLIKIYEKEKDINYIHQALNNLMVADTLVDFLEGEIFEEKSRLYWRKEASGLYFKAILCSHILGNNELAFTFSEKNRALLLTESIIKNARKVTLPEDVVLKENNLTKDLLHIESLLSTEKVAVQAKELQNQLFDLRVEYENFMDSLKSAFPDHYSLKSKTTLFSLEDIQRQLRNNDVVVSYTWDMGEDQFNSLFGILVTNTETTTFKIADSEEVERLATAYKQAISKPFETAGEQVQFNLTSHQLFNKLFPSERIKAQLKDKHLIIIPDGDLQNIPFEALISDITRNKYLIESNEISNAYSMSFLLRNKNVPRNAKENFIGFSPINFEFDDVASLPQAASEITAIQNIMGGVKLLGDKASKVNFLHQSDKYRIIHLATHAKAGENPWIAFSDSKLGAHELYTSKNQADLVVLSACNTAIGEISEGEGVMSLARGFFYAGANSVVSTLWNANDKSTSYIMEAFYRNLQKGENKSTALHLAKLQYIRSHSLSDISPYYWASFILIGDYEAATTDNYPVFSIFSIILLSFLLGIFLYRRIKK